MKKNGKKLLLCWTVLLAAALCCAMLVACNVDDVKEVTVTPNTVDVRIGEFNYSDYTVTATYGSGKTEESVLTEEMIAPKDRVKFFLEGEYDIEVTYLRMTTTMKVNVRRNVFAGAEFNDLDVVYNGEFYVVEVQNVPEGTTVTYPTTNRFRTAGEYQATAILRKDAFEMKEMTAKVTIRKADYDLSEVSFEDRTVEYDGTSHVLEMTGAMPTGLYVDYTITREGGREEKGNSATNAGSYLVEAKFSGDTVNFNEVEPKQAVLNIRQATIDVSGLTFEDKTVVYDRTKQSVTVAGTLPRGVSVSYKNNEHVDAGTYEATAVFSVDDTVNYADIPDKKATLTIQKANYDMSTVHFNGTKVTYDGTEKKIEIQGQLPTGLTVSYEGNEGTDAGTYKATAIFTSNNINYNNPDSMTATLIIDSAIAQMDQIVFERRRFISIVADKNSPYDESSDYDPYLVANEYRPDNVPVGFAMTVEYKKTTDWQADLTSETDEGPYIDRITEDGYYVVKVTFDGGKNYVDEKPTAKTVIRVDTLDNDDISTWEQLVFDNLWVNPETGNTTGVFMDYYTGVCVDSEHGKTVAIGDVTMQYCDCNVFLDFVDENSLLVDSEQDCYVPKEKLKDYQTFAESYFALIDQFNSGNYILSSGDFRWCSELYERNISGYNGTRVNVKYDDCNPFGMIAGDFGEIASLSKHATKSASNSTIVAFNSLSELFATFMGYFEIPTDGTEYIPTISSDASYAYTQFYNKAIELYNGSHVSFTKNIGNDLTRSAVIGVNHPYTMTFGTDVSPELINFQTVIANLFGFSSKTEFMNYAQNLANTYAQHRTNITNSTATNEALENGCFYTSNGSFVFPIAVKNELSSPVLAYVILDTSGLVSVWVNDITAALWATNFNVSYHTDSIINNELYCKNILFVTGPDFLTAAEKASNTLDHDEYYFEDDPSYPFVAGKAAYVSLNGASDYVVASYAGKVLADYHEVLAHLFGFEDVNDFYGTDKITGTVFGAYCDPTFLLAADVANDPLGAKGAIYVKDEDSEDYVFIFPYIIRFSEVSAEVIFLFCGSIGGETNYGALLSDAGALFDFFENATPADSILLEGRCLTTELYMTENGVIYRLSQKTKVVVENGTNVEKPITNGKDFVFIKHNDSTERLVYGDTVIYRFLTDLPGSCAEESAGYNPDEYKIMTDTTVYTFCDDDVFATVIKANGDATGITRRNAREDHPQMTSEIAEKFDNLSELYQDFLSNYVTGEDVVNEWKIGATNRNYATYRAFFEYASDMMAKSNRNMGKSSDYVLSKSVIIGMNRAFSIATNSSGYNYTVDQYRLMVAKLFGFTDLDTFKQYTDAIADVLVANGKYASVDTVSARLLYDGAVLTENGYFVLPYAIKSELTSNKVMAFIFVDQSGAMSVWINDAKNAFNATGFGETAWAAGDKNTVDVYGRCLMFEDDGYIMNEDLSQNVVEMIDKLQVYHKYVFRAGGVPENCNETNPDTADYYTYQHYLAGRCSELWFSFIYGYDDNNVSIWCDDCNPFCMLYSGWIFDDVDALKEHSLYPVPASIIGDFDSLSEYFSAVMSSVDIPTNDTQTVLDISNDALNRYATFYAKAMEIYDGSLLAFTRDVRMNFDESAVIGLDHPYVMTFGTTIDPSTVDYQLLVAHLFGIDDKDEFMSYVEQLAALYADYRDGIVVNKALENGCFFTANGSFVFPIAVQNELPSTVLAYLILDADGHVSTWINDIDAALWATSYDAEHLPDDDFSLRDKLYCKNMLFAKEINYNAIFMFCDDDALMTVQNANGDASAITKRVGRGDKGSISNEVAEKFDTLGELYAALFALYTIQENEDNNWHVAEGGANYAEYRRLFRYARDLFTSANNDLGKIDEYFLSGSAIIGMNKSFAISLADSDYSMDEYRLMIAKLFGFNDVGSFGKCVDALATALAANEAGAGVATIADRLVYDGAVRTENGYFILPYLIKNYTIGKDLLAFVFVDGDGTMAVWINNVKDAFDMTDFTIMETENDVIDYLYVSGRCVLFENNNDYVGWDSNGMAKYIAVEKVMSFASEGDFLIYSPFTDEEGFEVYWFSVYGFETEVIYDDSDTANIGTVNKGFYTMVNVASIDDVHAYNRYIIETYEDYMEQGEKE